MDAKVRTYDPKKIIATLGPVIFEGYAEGTFLAIAGNGQKFEKSKGADGTIDRINKNSADYSITFTTKQTSLTNDALSAILIADVANNQGVLPFTVKDLNGTTLFFAKSAWIANDPDDEYSDALGNREWLIDTGVADKFTGGNLA